MHAAIAEPDGSQRSLSTLVACHECDWLMVKMPVAAGERAQCPRCGYELYSHRRGMLQRCLALTVAALLLFIPANFLPLISLKMLGHHAEDSVWAGVQALWRTGMPAIAVVVLLCAMVIPLVKLLCVLAVLLSIRFNRARHIGLLLYRIYHRCREWGMLEIYLMGSLVAMVKLAGLAQLTLGVGAVCFVALVLLQVWLEVTLSSHQIWEALSGEDVHACH